MKYLLDTNACVTCLRRKPSPVMARLRSLHPSDVAICSIVRAELLYGALRAQDPDKERETVETFLAPMASLPFDNVAADRYADVRHSLERIGQRIGAHDLEVAAIALAHELTLITHNVQEFSRVPGLVFEDWQL